MINDRTLLKTFVRAWIYKGLASKQSADSMAGEMAYSLFTVTDNAETLLAASDVIKEVTIEIGAELRGEAVAMTDRPFETDTSTERHPNFD